MSSLYTIMVTAPFANTYNQIDSIQIDKDYRIKKGFTFESTLKASNGRYFIENCDDAKYIGRWVPVVACRVTKTEEFTDTDISENLPFDAEPCDVNIRLITDTCTVADYPRSITREVKLFTGAVLVCDRVLHTNIDANQLVRYRISDADRDELIGKWVQLDSRVTIDYSDDQYTETIEDAESDVLENTTFSEKLVWAGLGGASSTGASTSKNEPVRGSSYLGGAGGAQTTTRADGTTVINNPTDSIKETFCYIDDVNTSGYGGSAQKVMLVTHKKNGKTTYSIRRYPISKNTGKQVVDYTVAYSNVIDVRMKIGGMDKEYASRTTTNQDDWKLSAYQSGLSTSGDSSGAAANVDTSNAYEYGGGDYTEGVSQINLSGDGFNQLMKIYNLEWSNKSLMDVPLERYGFVHGLPFQFSRVADRRRGSMNQTDKYQSTDMYGMTYAREILAQLPIVVFTPGEPQFLTKLKTGFFGNAKSSTSIKDKWMPLLTVNATDNTVESAIQSLLNEGGDYDYYTMDIKMDSYFDYVNMLCKMCARNMGLDQKIKVGSAEKNPIHMNWNNYNKDIDVNCSNDSMMSILGMNQGVAFVFDPQSSITDSISNTTTESQVAGLLNNISATARELGFVANQLTGGTIGAGAAATNWDEIAASYKNGGDGKVPILDSIAHYVDGISNGLNVRFPEIWSDSSQTKSYSVDMHFISPYANKLCVWKHVLVPFWHIFALAAPRSVTKVTTYGSPFLIRAFSKGYFNVEMGIIESLSYKRFGDGDAISANGIPTQIDVTVDFKDMYHMLAMTPYTKGSISLFFNNAGLIELIGTLSGINMNRLGLGERLSLYVYTKVESVRTLGSNFMQHVRDRVRGVADKFYFGM